MKTKNSIDLKGVNDPCIGMGWQGSCLLLNRMEPGCGSYRCNFYKPEGCESWTRIEDKNGVNLIPPEDWKGYEEYEGPY